MSKALIVYSSRTGQTKVIGEFIVEGLRISGVESASLGEGIKAAHEYGKEIAKKLEE